MPCARAKPTAMRHAFSTAVIDANTDAPSSSVAMPAGVVMKNHAMSTSAITRSDVPPRSR
jgi:hypothetical protein